MKISMIGTGYVGLVSGTCFSSVGIDVTCVDIDAKKVEGLKKGIIPIYEPGLEDMVKKNYKEGRLNFTTKLKDSLEDCEAIFIAVGTPPGEDGSADLQHVIAVAREIGREMQQYMVVVTKSTVPVGTSEKVRAAVQEELDKRGSKLTFDVASNPEFLKEGNAVQDFLKPDRIVVGRSNEKVEKVMSRLYKPFTLNGHPVIYMDIASSEMTKYAANAMLATKISFMNDISILCELVGADVRHVRKGIGSDPRIGNKFIYPGTGYGGSCFPKDVKALVKTSADKGHQLRILEAVEAVNEDQKKILVKKCKKHFGENLHGKTFGIWGLAFKPETDDMREAPAIVIISMLLAAGAKVKAYDPIAMKEARHYFGDKIEYCKDQYEAAIEADAIFLVTEWPEFRFPNLTVLSKLMADKVLFDGRNIYDPTEIKEGGFKYYGIGRKAD